MKKNILAKIAASLFSMMVVLSSCNTDAEGTIYNPDAVANASFASTQMVVELSVDNAGKFEVPVYRGYTKGDASIAVTIEMNEETSKIFKIESNNVNFKDGEGVGYLVVKFNSVDELGATNKYNIKLTLPEESQSVSAEKTIDVVVNRKLTWESIGTGKYSSTFFGQTWDQTVEKAKEGNIYRLPDCITKGYPLIFTLSEDGQSLLSWDIQATGYKHSSAGMLYYKAASMKREANTLTFSVQVLMATANGYGVGANTTETLQMP